MMPATMMGERGGGREALAFAGPWVVFAVTAIAAPFAVVLLTMLLVILGGRVVPQDYWVGMILGTIGGTHLATIVAAIAGLLRVKEGSTSAAYRRALCGGILVGEVYLLGLYVMSAIAG